VNNKLENKHRCREVLQFLCSENEKNKNICLLNLLFNPEIFPELNNTETNLRSDKLKLKIYQINIKQQHSQNTYF